MTFPSHFPKQCPPESAELPNNGEVLYRLTKTNPTEEDLMSQYELGLPGSNTCEMRSVSFYDKIHALERLRAYPAHKDKVISKLPLQATWGLAQKGATRGSKGRHIHLWIFTDTCRRTVANYFEPCAAGEGN